MRTNGEGKPVIALDIDGSLGDYHGHFLKFAEAWFGASMPNPRQINNGNPLWQHMGVDHRDYRECKLAYRQGGMKRSMPAYSWAGPLTRQIRSMGAEVWLCTTRPYLRLDNIDPDTREWCRRNGIQYDATIFDTLDGKHTKYNELYRQAEKRVALILEDLPELIVAAAAIFQSEGSSLPVLLMMDQPYNKWFRNTAFDILERDGCYARRVNHQHQIEAEVYLALEEWRTRYGGA